MTDPAPFSILASDRWVEAAQRRDKRQTTFNFQYPRLGSLG